jgi:hypothetical protein
MSLYVEIVQIVQTQGLAVIFHVVRFSLQEKVVCGLVAGLRVHTKTSYKSTHHLFLQTKPNHMKDHRQTLPFAQFAQFPHIKTSATSTMHSVTP